MSLLQIDINVQKLRIVFTPVKCQAFANSFENYNHGMVSMNMRLFYERKVNLYLWMAK